MLYNKWLALTFKDTLTHDCNSSTNIPCEDKEKIFYSEDWFRDGKTWYIRDKVLVDNSSDIRRECSHIVGGGSKNIKTLVYLYFSDWDTLMFLYM